MKKFFADFKNSIYNPNYYKEILHKPFSYSFKYFLTFSLVVSFLMALTLSLVLLPKFTPILSNLELKVTRNYPQGLEVKVENGQASANVPQPYFIKTPQSVRASGSQIEKDNIIVLDTENTFNLDKFYSYKTISVLNKDSFTYLENDKLTIQSLRSIPNITINKENISTWIKSVAPFIGLFYPLFFVGVFIGMIFYFIFQMVYLLPMSLFIWLVAKMKNIKAGYWKSYQIGMHIISPLIILFFLLSAINLNFTFMLSLAVILMAIFNLKNEPRPNDIQASV